jgi:hypothetical protein
LFGKLLKPKKTGETVYFPVRVPSSFGNARMAEEKDFRYGKNPSDKNVLKNTLKMDDPQPSL